MDPFYTRILETFSLSLQLVKIAIYSHSGQLAVSDVLANGTINIPNRFNGCPLAVPEEDGGREVLWTIGSRLCFTQENAEASDNNG